MIDFHKYEGAGNDFVLVEQLLSVEEIRRICDRKRGVGSDGLIVLSPSNRAESRMAFFNPDATRAALCGNGLRCAALHLLNKGTSSPFTIESDSGMHKVCVRGQLIGVQMVVGQVVRELELDGEKLLYTETGVPHAYILCKNVMQFDLERAGRHFVSHKAFPEGCNINALQIEGSHLYVRTFERGVNNETLACGTGAMGAAAVSRLKQATVHTLSGDLLVVEEDILFGPATKVFSGTWGAPAGAFATLEA